ESDLPLVIGRSTWTGAGLQVVVRCNLVGRVLGIGLIGCAQAGGDQIIRKPERRRRIHGIRTVVCAVVAVPRITRPSPRVINRCRQRIVSPSVVDRVVVVGRIVAIVGTSAVVVPAVDAGAIGAVIVVGSRVVGTPTTDYVGALHVSTAPSIGEDAGTVARC